VLAQEPDDQFAAGEAMGYTAGERRERARANRDTGFGVRARLGGFNTEAGFLVEQLNSVRF
jgi:hypothetical protein